MNFKVSKNETRKQIFFFELTDYKQIFLKVRSNRLKFLENYRNFSKYAHGIRNHDDEEKSFGNIDTLSAGLHVAAQVTNERRKGKSRVVPVPGRQTLGPHPSG